MSLDSFLLWQGINTSFFYVAGGYIKSTYKSKDTMFQIKVLGAKENIFWLPKFDTLLEIVIF